jgi:general secretion pathway protein H
MVMKRRLSERGVTLIEVMITMSILALAMGMVTLGANVADSARLKRSAVMIAGAVRVAYGHANAISRPVRLVFDFDERLIGLEEASSELKLARNDATGGAAAATEAEKKALEEAEQIVKGPRAPRPAFKPTRAFGFNPDKDKTGKELERNIRFLQIETGHQDEGENQGRSYLYFWPGGQTERAAIQLKIAGSDEDQDVMTILVSPLTGKATLKKGKFSMPRPRDEDEESERQDTGF